MTARQIAERKACLKKALRFAQHGNVVWAQRWVDRACEIKHVTPSEIKRINANLQRRAGSAVWQ